MGNGSPDPAAFATSLDQYTAGLRIIYTQSERPYKCLFQWPPGSEFQVEVQGDLLLVHCTGYAKRIGKKEVATLESGRQSGWDRN